MSERISPIEQQDQENTSGGISIDYKRVLGRAIRYWYIVVISLAIAIATASIINRYTVKIYQVTTSLIIRETEETSGAELLYKNALIDPYRNYLNEPYIIRSYSLIEKILQDLNFGTIFYREGNVVTSEIYPMPVAVKLAHPEMSYGANFIFTILDDEKFQLKNIGEEKLVGQTFRFGDSVVFNGHHLLIEKKPKENCQWLAGVPLIMSLQNPGWLVGNFGMNVKWAEEGAGVIDLSLSGPNAQKNVDFFYGLIKTYQQRDLDKKNLIADRTIKFIRKQLVHIADSLGFSESELENFKTKKDEVVLDLADQSQKVNSKIKELESMQAELLLRSKYFAYLINYLNNNQNLDQIILPGVMNINDGVVAGLISKMTEMQSSVNLYVKPKKEGSPNTKEENPGVISKRSSIIQIQKEILEAVATLKATDKIKSDLINAQLKTAEDKLAMMPRQQRRFEGLQRNYHLLEGLYIFLNQKMAEAQISMASNISDIVIVNPPMAGGATTPKTQQNYMIAVFLALLIPLVGFAVVEILNNKIQSKEDIEKLTQIPFIGGIGHIKSDSNLEVYHKPKSAAAESFRALRSNLSYFTGSAEKKMFMITSSIGGEGKTFTTINLASVLAMSSRKILVVGADMRKPKLFDDFGLDNSIGLSNYLSGSATFEQGVRKTKIEGIDVITGGPVPPNPAELLMLPRMEEFCKIALERYDYVLLDTPPIAIVSDALMLTKHVDHIVFVTRQGYTPKHFLKTIEEYYRTGRLDKISILLNDISKTGPGYGYNSYGYNYGYGYGYGSGKKKNGHGYYTEG